MNCSPSDIEVMIHYHCSSVKHPRHDAPAVRKARERFLEHGLIEPAPQFWEDCFVTTEKGKRFMKMLCNTPFPEERYLDPRGADTTISMFNVMTDNNWDDMVEKFLLPAMARAFARNVPG